MTVRIVVADESEALFFDASRVNATLAWIGKVDNEVARLRDRDLESDRPGTTMAGVTGQRSAVDGERSTRRSSHEKFARQIAAEIERGRKLHEFDRVVVIAGPRMLGLIREALSAPTRRSVVSEVSKDLVHSDEESIRRHVPRGAFRNGSASA